MLSTIATYENHHCYYYYYYGYYYCGYARLQLDTVAYQHFVLAHCRHGLHVGSA